MKRQRNVQEKVSHGKGLFKNLYRLNAFHFAAKKKKNVWSCLEFSC